MKQKLLLKSLLLLCALIVGSGSAWADTSTLTFTAACEGSGTADDGVKWTVTSDGTESIFDNTKGIHYGTSNGQVTYIKLSTSKISGTVTEVVVNASTASGVTASVSVTIGGNAYGGDAQSLTTSATNYTFEGSASGDILVTVTKPSKAAKAIYVKSIAVTYSTGSPSDPSITASDVNIAYSATSGSITYTLNNATGNVTATVTNGDWLTLGTITEDEVQFSCDANTGAARTAEVTLSYEGATDKVVTVTQAAAPSITTGSNSLTGFTYVEGNGPSAAKTISVSGSNLVADIALSLGDNSNYEMSETENGTYTNSLTLSPTNGTVSATNIYVRLRSGLEAGDKNGAITLTSTDASNTTVTLSGSVTTLAVTYDANGADTGTVPTDATGYAYNSSVTVLGNIGEPALAKTGYAFGGWCMNSEGTEPVYGPNNTTTFAITANTTLYAKWNPYSITAQSNNNSYGTVQLNGFVITASPVEGYTYASPAYTVSSGTATVEQNGNEFTVTPTSDCTVTINFEAIPTHTATFSVNGSTTSNTFYEDQTISFPSDPAAISGKSFVGWATATIDGTTNTAPSFVTSATMGNSDVTYYAVFADVTGTTAASWTETALGSLTSSDIFVIVGNNGDTYALPSADASSAPSATSIGISEGKIDETGGAVADNLKWNISGNSTDGYTFYPNGSTTKYLYILNNNDGVRVGKPNANTTEEHALTVTDGYLTAGFSSARYIGIYNSSNWRCYTSKTSQSNIANQTFAFYKYTAGSTTYSNYCTTVVVTYSVTYDGNGATSGSVPEDNTAYTSGQSVTVAGNTGNLAKTGYAFDGWNTQNDGQGTNYAANETFSITANTTLYAKWNAKTITGLSYTGTPTKTTYSAGESFDPTGLTVTATYNDASQEDVTSLVTWAPDPLTVGTTSVTGTYQGQTVNVSGLTVKGAAGSISITADAPVNVTAAEGDGELALAYENLTISQASDFDVQFYDANDDEISKPDWIDVEVVEADPSGYKVYYVVSASEVTSARSAYFKVYAMDDNTDLAYSNKVTITQAAYVPTTTYTLVTSVTPGKTYIVASGKTGSVYAMGYDKGNNRDAVSVQAVAGQSETTITVEGSSGVYEMVLYGPDANGYYTFYDANRTSNDVADPGYLYAVSGSNALKTKSTIESDGKWSIAINGTTDVATVKVSFVNGETTTDRIMRFNNGNSKLFSCYTNGQQDIYLYEKSGEPVATTVSKTLNAKGYATFATTTALDFLDADAENVGYSAWQITGISGETITFSQIKSHVAAGTGILLKGSANDDIDLNILPVGGADLSSSNKLEGITTATVVAADTYYGLSGNAFVPVNAGTVPAGKALLPANEVGNARALTFVFEDASGISTIEHSPLTIEDGVYNLQGQRVNTPKKGLYIVNGKKVVMK